MSNEINNILEKIEVEVMSFFQDDFADVKNSSGRSLDDLSMFNINRILEPGKDLLLRGGKRWRPLIMCLVANSFSEDENILKLAPIVEIAHNGTLIIDDIEDLSEVRRGKPSVHKIYGEDVAINAGNQMYFLALFNIEKLNLPAEKKAKFYEIYSRYMRRLHFGQGMDILWHKNTEEIPSIDEYLQMCRLKTGSLAAMALEFGLSYARSRGAIIEEESYNALVDAAENMGIGFQIADDVKNLVGKIEGKDKGDDIVEGKKSLPVILFLKSQNEEAKAELFKCFEKAKDLGIEEGQEYILRAIELLESSLSIKKASKIGFDLLDQAINNFTKFLPKSKNKTHLLELIDSFLKEADIVIDRDEE